MRPVGSVGEAQHRYLPVACKHRGVGARVHPPDEKLCVELLRHGVTEDLFGTPCASPMTTGLEGAAGRLIGLGPNVYRDSPGPALARSLPVPHAGTRAAMRHPAARRSCRIGGAYS